MQDGLEVQLHSKSLEPCPMSPSTQGKGWWGECACPSAIPAIPKAPSPPSQWQWQWRGGMATGGANGHTQARWGSRPLAQVPFHTVGPLGWAGGVHSDPE